MKKQFITGFLSGALIFGVVGALAATYTATDNPFPVKLNGNDVQIEGYNIEGSTYFKLRDIADTVGGFEVGFQNNTIQLSKDGYVYGDSLSIYTSENGLAVPDYGKMYNVDVLETSGINTYSLLYQTNCEIYAYPYDKDKIINYQAKLEDLGFTKVHSGSDKNYSNVSLYQKNNNYVKILYDDNWNNCIELYPINNSDYAPLLNSDTAVQKIDEYKTKCIGYWQNDKYSLILSSNEENAYAALFNINGQDKQGFFEIFSTHLTVVTDFLTENAHSYKFEYLPETDQLLYVEENSILNRNN